MGFKTNVHAAFDIVWIFSGITQCLEVWSKTDFGV